MITNLSFIKEAVKLCTRAQMDYCGISNTKLATGLPMWNVIRNQQSRPLQLQLQVHLAALLRQLRVRLKVQPMEAQVGLQVGPRRPRPPPQQQAHRPKSSSVTLRIGPSIELLQAFSKDLVTSLQTYVPTLCTLSHKSLPDRIRWLRMNGMTSKCMPK